MMKKTGFLLALICILSLTGCGMIASAEEETLQLDTEENTVSVNFDDVATQSEPTEQFCNHLVQFTESTFTDEEGIESADAIVSYVEGTEQYSIELLMGRLCKKKERASPVSGRSVRGCESQYGIIFITGIAKTIFGLGI